jgi:hypothetical protein
LNNITGPPSIPASRGCSAEAKPRIAAKHAHLLSAT